MQLQEKKHRVFRVQRHYCFQTPTQLGAGFGLLG